MAEPGQKQSAEAVKSGLKEFLSIMDVEILKEYDDSKNWGFWIKMNDFPVMIDNQKGLAYCMVILQITLPDKGAIEDLNRHYSEHDNQFIFELTRILTTNRVSFTRIIEGNSIVGYSLATYLYPFHNGFSINELDRAIHAVVAVGNVGVAFLKTVIGHTEFRHTPGTGSEPGPVFE